MLTALRGHSVGYRLDYLGSLIYGRGIRVPREAL